MFTDLEGSTATLPDDTAPMRRPQRSIYEYVADRRDPVADGLAAVDWRGDETVVDVGCGNGQWLRRLPPGVRRIGVDLSPGMLSAAAATAGPVPLVQTDAEALPFADDIADVGLAMHVLYHVVDIRAAVAELRRVVRPGGVQLVTTNGEAHLAELIDVLFQVTGTEAAPRATELRFTAETARGYLEQAFGRVEATRFRSELLVPDAEPVVAYLDTLRGSVEPSLPPDRTWHDVITEARRRVTARLPFRAGTDSAIFVCR